MRKAANGAGEDTSSSRPRREATVQAEHIASRMEEEVAGQDEAQDLDRPRDQESSHGDSQMGWDAEQDWLQECADLAHEVGPWTDLMG